MAFFKRNFHGKIINKQQQRPRSKQPKERKKRGSNLMGVQGLWELLAPVGRRVSVETLAGKKLAIDASIWMVQFMKAMRDDKGEMVRNAHLLGFFRRICKLLFLRTKPVFVFDGATPALKRRTVAARRRHRDSARAKIRKTAEKLLLNHLKAKRLEELAAEIKKQKEGSKEKQITDEDTKGKKVLDSNDDTGAEGSSVLPHGDLESGVSSQKNLDELLAASLAAEEEMEINKNVLTSEGGLDEAEDDNDENEEIIFPMDHTHIDPAVLASLPPSMQLDLLVQMRESIMAENRQKYQKIKKAPTKFSELQIQSYLKTIAFRREINEVQKCAAGRGIAGVQTSRIASEANREFIFSSSFTGDKQVLASRGVANSGNGDHYSLAKQSTSDSANCSLLSSQPKLVKEVSVSKRVKDFGPDVETYCDENGRVRVSRVKGLGICMTRDLQRNLDLMEKYEQEKTRGDNSSDREASHTRKVVDVSEGLSGNNHSPSVTSNEGKGETFTEKSRSLPLDRRGYMDEHTIHGSEDAIEISFSEDDSGMKATDDDNIFMQLVSGGQTANLPLECVHSDKSTNDSESDCSWEEGLVKEISEIPNDFVDITASPKSDLKKNQSSLAESSYEVADVDWEEGVCHNPDTSSEFLDKPVKDVSRGMLEEEADIQEAIRRSLKDFKEQNSSTNSSAVTELERSMKDQISDGVILHKLVTNTCVHLDNDAEESPSCNDGQLDNHCKEVHLQIPDSSKNNLDSYNLSGLDLDGESSLISRAEDEQNVMTSQRGNIPPGKPSDGHPSWLEQSLDASYEVQIKSCSRMSTEELCEIRPNTSSKIPDDGSKVVVGSLNHDSRHISTSSVSPERGYNNSLSGNSSLMEEIIDTGVKSQQNNAEKDNVISDHIGYSTQILNNQMEVSEASLDKEISLLRQERVNLGNEQRMLERDAESVNNEMFAECQELLQMFGLPYIIAPTEAEAQCAYMEMTNLVDGVVTDDSDVFLFGARSVYKNIFDDRKYVETYFMKDVECELGLDRDKLIRMALLLGSDYTEGVSGIGIVNAIEVIHAFPEEDGLQKFRQWVESPDPAILGKLVTGSHSNRSLKENSNGADAIKRSSQGDASEESVSRGHDDEKPTGNEAIKDIFIDKHRNVSKNWHIPPSFPGEMVISAYTSPQVDESTDPFMWGKPDLPLLRKLCWEKFGWATQKADELLVPVLKEYNKHETQLRLEAFYTFNERFAKVRSQRIKKALKGITGTLSSDLTDEFVKEGPSSRKKRCTGLSAGEEYKPESSTGGGNSKRGKKVPRQSRGQKTEKEFIYSEDLAGESLILEKDDIDDTSVLSLNTTVKRRRGRGRGRGRGARGRGKGRGRSSPIKADSDSTDDGDDYNANVQLENHSKVPEVLPKLRRSMRPSKQVQYAEEDFEVDESNGTLNLSGSKLLGVATEQEPIENDRRSRVGDLSDVDKGAHTFSKDRSSGEHLSSGGGFCLDDNDLHGDAIQLAASPIQGSAEMDREDRDGCNQRAPEDDTSRGYLFSGGGFCMDESDEQVDATRPTSSQIQNSRPSRVTFDISEDPQNFSGHSVPDDTKQTSEPLQDSSSLVENITSFQDGQSNLGLSAMSSLRRKRRKT